MTACAPQTPLAQLQGKTQSLVSVSSIKSCHRRSVTALMILAASCCTPNSVQALSATNVASRPSPYASILTLSSPTPAETSPTQADTDLLKPHSWTDTVLMDDGLEDDLEDVQLLQQSVSSDVPESVLQRQIDASLQEPNLFLETHVEDASWLEKVAMSSVPEQLPKQAVEALKTTRNESRQSNKNSKKKKTSSIRDLDFSKQGRVTPEQEIMLAQLIQKGVQLHKCKTDLEAKLGRDISKSEWMEAADISSVKELRQTVLEYRRAKQVLVTANMGLVHAVVQSLRHEKSALTYEEMVQEGSLGLLRAAELFDPSRGLRFSTYATIWIKGVLSNSHHSELVTLPSREKTKWNKMRKAQEEFRMQHDRDATLHELAGVLQMSVEELLLTQRKMTQAQQVLSLDYEYQTSSRSGSEQSTMATLQNNDKAFMSDVDLAERTQLQADLVAALARNLDAREARLMRLRYGLVDGQTRSIAECAEAMGLSRTRVQQLAQACLQKLRKAKEMESLQEYLLTIA